MGRSSANESSAAEIYPETGSSSSATGLRDGPEISSVRGLTRSISRMSNTDIVEYRVYKRRFFGLVQLVLLNIVVSWGWITFASISTTTAQYFNTTESAVNWLSTAVLFAFVVVTPLTFYTLAKHGPKASIVVSSVLLLAGNWIRYGGTRANSFGVVMFGQLLIGFAQPFVLSAPTTYSDVWFSAAGRTSATAIASLANPLGAALGQLISPMWATDASKIPNTVLYIAIIASVATIPSFFIPAKPPTPPAPSISVQDRRADSKSLKNDIKTLLTSPEFYLLFIPFGVLVGNFNAFSSLINQTLSPYNFTEDEAGIAGALLIFVGLLSAAISSPLVDKFKFYVWYIRIAVPITCISYLILIWAPQSRSLAYVSFVCALDGAASFGLVPVALEYLVELHYPLGPEVNSSLCWCAGQLLGGIFIIIMDHLKIQGSRDPSGRPQGDLYYGLVFQAVLSMVVMPLPLCLGLFGRGDRLRNTRWQAEVRARARGIDYDEHTVDGDQDQYHDQN